MKLNWLSPLPPVQSAGGEYTRHVLPELARLADVTLWTLKSDWDPELEKYAAVRRIAGDFWRELNRADMSIFNIGNNAELYGELWNISRQHPGVVILHSLGFMELFAKTYLVFLRDIDGFREIMKRFYGDQGLDGVRRLQTGRSQIEDLSAEFPLTDYCLERALAVVVASQEGFAHLGDDGRRWIFHAALPFAPSTPRPAERRIPGDGKVLRIIDFAYPEENRCTTPVLEALAQTPERERFILDVYGDLRNPEELKRRRDALGLGSNVCFHGVFCGEKIDDALKKADLAIHLRRPTLGEASPGLLRSWEHALPSLVSRSGWHEELDEEAVRFVRPEREVEDVKDALSSLAEDPAPFLKMGQRGRQILEQKHGTARCARRLIKAASEARGFLSSAVAMQLAERAGAEIGRWPSGKARATAAKKVSEALSSLFAAES